MYTLRLKSTAKVIYRDLVGSRLYEKLEFRRHLGYWPNLDQPRTFNEKVCARKFQPFPLAPVLADKLAVREFVKSRVGSDVLTHLYYSGNSPKSISYSDLPSRFVLKATHGSGPDLRALIWDKYAMSKRNLLAMASRMLRRRCGPEVNEWWYTKIPPGVLIEEMLLEDGKIPTDFKFYVFDGVAFYVQVIEGRHQGEARGCFYDPKWRVQPFVRESFTGAPDVAKPKNLSAMIAVAEALGAGFDFIRVDLYSPGERVVFGEMTLAPGAGWVRFRPVAYDFILGQHWPSKSLKNPNFLL